nr:hypothetical protein [Pseudomonadota bacterium]
LLAPGLPAGLQALATQALVWSALAVPAALVAALWVTRLQHGRDFVGLYSASLVVNLVLLAAIAGASLAVASGGAVARLGAGLLVAAGLRLVWLHWRQGSDIKSTSAPARSGLPAAPVWLWAVLSASLPLALPFVARSMASQAGEGSLATFNYAWKLVELPLLLVIQLVATLAFPGIARALTERAATTPPASRHHPVRLAFALAFSLACASAAGLLAGAPALARLLFGWGRMGPDALERVAQWGRIAAWGLLPQALIAVALTVLAARARMRVAVLGYAVALAGLLGAGFAGAVNGGDLMWILNALLAVVAAVTVAAMGHEALDWLPWQVLFCASGALLLVACTLSLLPAPQGLALGLVQAVVCSGAVLSAAWWASGGLRREPGHNSSAPDD